MTPVVSCHATDRFLERFPGVECDRTTARNTIASLVARGVQFGAASVYVAGFTFCLEGPVVTTVFRGRHRGVERQAALCRRRIMREARA